MSNISHRGNNNGSTAPEDEDKSIQKLRVAAEKEELIISPINLTIRASAAIQLPRLIWYNFHLTPKKIKVTNTGHTVILSAKWYDKRPFINEGPLLSNYVFSQVHFHWGLNDHEGSEHTVDGKRYPLEMHVVHFKSEYHTQEEALLQKDGLIVVGYFFQIQDEDNACMEEIVNVFSCIVRPHTSARVDVFRIEDLFRPFADDYFLYWGSVMSASCYHQILWAFNREPIGISSPQLSKFRQLLDKDGNPLMKTFRSTNSLGNRTLFHVNPSDYLATTLIPTSLSRRFPAKTSRNMFDPPQPLPFRSGSLPSDPLRSNPSRHEPLRTDVHAYYNVDRDNPTTFSELEKPRLANLPYKIIINDLHQVELVYKPSAENTDAVRVITLAETDAPVEESCNGFATTDQMAAFSLNCASLPSGEMDDEAYGAFIRQKSVSFNHFSQVQFPNRTIATERAKGIAEEDVTTSDSIVSNDSLTPEEEEAVRRHGQRVLSSFYPTDKQYSLNDIVTTAAAPSDLPLSHASEELESRLFCDAGTQSPSGGLPQRLDDGTQTSYFLSVPQPTHDRHSPPSSPVESETSSYIYKYKMSPVNSSESPTGSQSPSLATDSESSSGSLRSLPMRNKYVASSSKDSPQNYQPTSYCVNAARGTQTSPLFTKDSSINSPANETLGNFRLDSRAPGTFTNPSTHSQPTKTCANTPKMYSNSSIDSQMLEMSAHSNINSYKPQTYVNCRAAAQTPSICSGKSSNSRPSQIDRNVSSISSRPPSINASSFTNRLPQRTGTDSPTSLRVRKDSPMPMPSLSPCDQRSKESNFVPTLRNFSLSSSIDAENVSIQSEMSDISSDRSEMSRNALIEPDVPASRFIVTPVGSDRIGQVDSGLRNHYGNAGRRSFVRTTSSVQPVIEEEANVGPAFNHSAAAVGGYVVGSRDVATQYSKETIENATQYSKETIENATQYSKETIENATQYSKAAIDYAKQTSPPIVKTVTRPSAETLFNVPPALAMPSSVLLQVSELGSTSSMVFRDRNAAYDQQCLDNQRENNAPELFQSTRYDFGTQAPTESRLELTFPARQPSQTTSNANKNPINQTREGRNENEVGLRMFGCGRDGDPNELASDASTSVEVLVSENKPKVGKNIMNEAICHADNISDGNIGTRGIDIGVQWSNRSMLSRTNLATQTSFYCSHMPRLGLGNRATTRNTSKVNKRDSHFSEFDWRELNHANNVKSPVKRETSTMSLREPNAFNKSCNDLIEDMAKMVEPNSRNLHRGPVAFQVRDVFLDESKSPLNVHMPKFSVLNGLCESMDDEERHLLTSDLGTTNSFLRTDEQKALGLNPFTIQPELQSIFKAAANEQTKPLPEGNPCFTRSTSHGNDESVLPSEQKHRNAWEKRVQEQLTKTLPASKQPNDTHLQFEKKESVDKPTDGQDLASNCHRLLQKDSMARTIANSGTTPRSNAIGKQFIFPVLSTLSRESHVNVAAVPGGLIAPAASRKDWNPRLAQAVDRNALDAAVEKLENWDSHVNMSRRMGSEKTDWPTCPLEWNGKLQSPIVIERSHVKDVQLPALQFKHHFDATGGAVITNTGNTVEMRFTSSVRPLLSGGPLYGGGYVFDRLQMNWIGSTASYGSSHRVGDKIYPMEIHLVHYLLSSGSYNKAVDHPHGLAIVAFFLEAGDKDDLYFEDLLSALAKVTRPYTTANLSSETLQFLGRAARPGGYFTYPGSLTSPPYSETVVWIVYPGPVTVSHRQVAEYRKLSERSGHYGRLDFRPFQPLNDRPIFYAR